MNNSGAFSFACNKYGHPNSVVLAVKNSNQNP